jgi:hypothetical protein
MATRECYRCKEQIEEGTPHDCWTTTEEHLTRDLSEDLMDAWERLRETASSFGEQRIYASHRSIMFSRKACYFFVRPRKSFLEVWFFLGRKLKDARVRKIVATSKVKLGHLIHIKHRDEVESPITDWLEEAYGVSEKLQSPVQDARKKKAKKKADKGTSNQPHSAGFKDKRIRASAEHPRRAARNLKG